MRTGRLRALETGAVGSAVAASICCLGPLLLAVLGVGGGALFLKFEPYQLHFAVMTVLLLGAAFYFAYRKGASEECEAGTDCAPPRAKQRVGLWIATGIVAILTVLSYLARL